MWQSRRTVAGTVVGGWKHAAQKDMARSTDRPTYRSTGLHTEVQAYIKKYRPTHKLPPPPHQVRRAPGCRRRRGAYQGCTGPFFFLRVSRSRVNSAPGQAAPAPEQDSPGSPTSPGYPEASKKISGFKSLFFLRTTRGNKTLWGKGGEGKTAHICLIPHFLTYATTYNGRSHDIYSYLDYMENCYKAPNTRCDSVPLLAEVCTRKV